MTMQVCVCVCVCVNSSDLPFPVLDGLKSVLCETKGTSEQQTKQYHSILSSGGGGVTLSF
ncbi:hypothetical protein INR49_002692 [Caranx melampygus]|nr:hypothetical protein INR49_002692 [Caranx melampygus]